MSIFSGNVNKANIDKIKIKADEACLCIHQSNQMNIANASQVRIQ